MFDLMVHQQPQSNCNA